jgi:hypothetical protein
MNELDLAEVYRHVEENIGLFHTKRLDKLNDLNLNKVLFRKNPYLFKAKHILTAEALVKSIVDAYLSSQEETIFGDFLEGIAVFVSGKVYGGYKPEIGSLIGIDLVFERDENIFMVEIKSGPHWGNSSQIKKMMQNFHAAKHILQEQFPDQEIIAINGCSYGKDAHPQKRLAEDGGYWKLCGQDFWSHISGNEQFYLEIIEPLGHQAKARNEAFDQAYARVINRFTVKFAQDYCTPEGDIDWELIVRLISERHDKSPFLGKPLSG